MSLFVITHLNYSTSMVIIENHRAHVVSLTSTHIVLLFIAINKPASLEH